MVDQECNRGEAVVFSVSVIGTPIPEAHFYKDGKQIISSALKYEIRHDVDNDLHLLIIRDADIDDCAEFACHAANVAGEAWSFANMAVHDTGFYFALNFSRKKNKQSQTLVTNVIVGETIRKCTLGS